MPPAKKFITIGKLHSMTLSKKGRLLSLCKVIFIVYWNNWKPTAVWEIEMQSLVSSLQLYLLWFISMFSPYNSIVNIGILVHCLVFSDLYKIDVCISSLQQRDELSGKHSTADGVWSHPGSCPGAFPVWQQHQRDKSAQLSGGTHRHPGHARIFEPPAGPPVFHLSTDVQRVPAQTHAHLVYWEVCNSFSGSVFSSQ